MMNPNLRRRAPWMLAFAVFLMCGGNLIFAAVDPITGAEPGEGFGGNATGGYGQEVVTVTTFSEFAAAIKRNNVYIKVQGNLNATATTIGSGSNITIDGQGSATIFGNHSAGQRMLELLGKNIVIKDIRLRNSGDNLSLKAPADNILISHVSTTGAYDDGMSIAYGTKNVTVQYSVFFGCTRSCFMADTRNTPQNISLHHNWFKGQWIRGPLVQAVINADIRNQLSEDWASWGGPRFEQGATGNCINSTFVMTGAAAGKTDSAYYGYSNPGLIYQSGNVTRGCSGRPLTFTSSTEIPCAPVTTHTAAEAEAIVRASAGCLPRDAIDLAYIAATSWPPVGETTPWVILPAQVGPTATVTGPASPTTNSPIVFTIAFNKSVTGLTAAGITVTNGTKGTLSGSGANYTLSVTPHGPGPVTCKINAGVAQDSGGLGNTESNTASVIYEAPEIPEDLSSWAYRQTLRFAGFTGSEPLTSFPLLVRLDSARFAPENFEPEGADLRFADPAGNPLPYEIEAWDRDGESLIWVAVPQIASNTDTIEMLWGKPGVLSRARPGRVWTNGFLGVWHLESSLQDSSSAGRHGTNSGTGQEDGIIGWGANFDGASFVSLPPAGNSGVGSMSFWMKTSTSADRTMMFYLRAPGASSTPGLTNPGQGYGSQYEMHVDFMPDGLGNVFLNFAIEGGVDTALDVRATADQAYANGQWNHVAATWEKPGNCYVYVNGEVVAATEHVALVYEITQFAALGKPEADLRYYTGLMDEARLCAVPRSADWVRASYLNQKRDSTFVVFESAVLAASMQEWIQY